MVLRQQETRRAQTVTARNAAAEVAATATAVFVSPFAELSRRVFARLEGRSIFLGRTNISFLSVRIATFS